MITQLLKKKFKMGNIPLNIKTLIASHLSFATIIAASLVNKKYYHEIIGNNNFWRYKSISQFGLSNVPPTNNYFTFYSQNSHTLYNLSLDNSIYYLTPFYQNVQTVSCGSNHVTILSFNTVYVKGLNDHGQLGIPSIKYTDTFIELTKGIKTLQSLGSKTTLVDFKDTLYGCGQDSLYLGIDTDVQDIQEVSFIIDKVDRVFLSPGVLFIEIDNMIYVSSNVKSKLFPGTTFYPVGPHIQCIWEENNRLIWLTNSRLYFREAIDYNDILLAKNVLQFHVYDLAQSLVWLDKNHNLYIYHQKSTLHTANRLYDLYGQPIEKSRRLTLHKNPQLVMANVKQAAVCQNSLYILTLDNKIHLYKKDTIYSLNKPNCCLISGPLNILVSELV